MKLRSRPTLLLLTLSLLLAGVLAACAIVRNTLPTSQPPQPSPQATAMPAPQAGKANLTVHILGKKDGKPLADVAVRLAQVYRQGGEGAYVLDLARSPVATTDTNGFAFIQDFFPYEYFIIVGEPGDNHYYIVQDDQTLPIPYKTEKDKTLDAGTLTVDFVP